MNEISIIVAKYFILLPFIGAIIVAIQLKPRKEKVKYAIALVASGVIALLLAHLAGSIYNNPRPFVVGHFTPLIAHVASNGFPSDHTLLAALIGWVTLLYSRKYGIILLGIALLIGLSRVFVGVHHIEDIIASFVITGLAVLLVRFIMNRIPFTKRV